MDEMTGRFEEIGGFPTGSFWAKKDSNIGPSNIQDMTQDLTTPALQGDFG